MNIKVLASLGIVSLILIVCFSSYVTYHNLGNKSEKGIVYEYENLQNILGQYSLKIKEAAQVPGMQTDDLVELFTGSLDARYGSDGSQASMQWIKEQNPNLNQETYIQLQRMMEAGRNKFENHQSRFIDHKRTYEVAMGNFWGGMWLGFAGYPNINLDDYKTITSSHAKKTFETGIDEGITLITR